MLFNAILMRILHNDPAVLLGWFLILAGIVGLLSPLFVTLILDLFSFLFSLTPKAKARRKRKLNAELLHKYEGACRVIVEQGNEIKCLREENIHFAGLLNEDLSHKKDLHERAQRELDARNQRLASEAGKADVLWP